MLRLASIFFMLGAVACSSSSRSTGAGGSGSVSGAGGGRTAGANAASSSASGGGGFGFGGAGGGGGQIKARVYASTLTELYELDPNTNAVTDIGPFSSECGPVYDIAVDKDGKMVATTMTGLFAIDTTTAKCTLIVAGQFGNSLTYVPAGTVDPNVEVLVGYSGHEYRRIDAQGTQTTIGDLGVDQYMSSGDIVSVIGGGTYLTVTGGTDCSEFDCLLEVNPKTGAMKKNIGSLGHSGVYGLAYWGAHAFGFDYAGDIFAIDVTTGMTTNIPNPTSMPTFSGAGSSTAAPFTPPK